ncbi:MAG TPA: hypothetical protein IAC04_07255 [Candidatus Coprenecus stercoravium]|uniref:Uncharacterized protein n=1 Tax=Candidatus Coprenecus stercoravium TaxID=2840735 RepID=A0A9D2GRW9_9BACT|nr:hypothetical protein [Candidatus Coprenecus stercoravium]
MTIFRYKAVIPGNKIFMREYDLDAGMSLFKLHEFLNRDLGFSPDQMTVFETISGAGKVLRRIGLFDFGDGSMDKVTVEDTFRQGERVLRYVYNMTLNLFLELSFEGESEYNQRRSYPLLVTERGNNPSQFSAVYEDYGVSEAGRTQSEPEEDVFEEDELPEGEETM